MADNVAELHSDYPVSADSIAGPLAALALKIRAEDAIASIPALTAEARGWLTDCFDSDFDIISPEGIASFISRHYDGGAVGFYLNSRSILPTITNN
jgi:hypothetical protein